MSKKSLFGFPIPGPSKAIGTFDTTLLNLAIVFSSNLFVLFYLRGQVYGLTIHLLLVVLFTILLEKCWDTRGNIGERPREYRGTTRIFYFPDSDFLNFEFLDFDLPAFTFESFHQ